MGSAFGTKLLNSFSQLVLDVCSFSLHDASCSQMRFFSAAHSWKVVTLAVIILQLLILFLQAARCSYAANQSLANYYLSWLWILVWTLFLCCEWLEKAFFQSIHRVNGNVTTYIHLDACRFFLLITQEKVFGIPEAPSSLMENLPCCRHCYSRDLLLVFATCLYLSRTDFFFSPIFNYFILPVLHCHEFKFFAVSILDRAILQVLENKIFWDSSC